MDKKTTKERILETVIDLFSEKGYDGVGVDEIAESIGMKGPSLYRHFKGKEAILDAVISIGEDRYEDNFGSADKLDYVPESMDKLIEMSLQQINFTMHDPMIIKFRKIFAMEQFRNERIAELTTKHTITGLMMMYAKIFSEMMQQGTLREGDPEILALEYLAPVSMMIHMVDRQPEKEDMAMDVIKRHFVHFANIYNTESF
ncbi:MAG: TetR/AcrR family transcriptional regulator [Lachnospiraceae bacterium]|nr:TetR/AcrR family transcriptional regulator [Lachnospiraceae bacterium]